MHGTLPTINDELGNSLRVPVTLQSSDGTPIGENGTIETVQSDDVTVTGPTSLSALNVNLLTGDSSWYDVKSFQSGSIHIIASAGITAGQIIFEQTNDITATAVPLRASEVNSINTNPLISAFAIAASASRIFKIQIDSRFIRVRISTAFIGGTVRSVSQFSQRPTSYPVVNIQQQSQANLLATVYQALGSIATRWFMTITDGTNSMPTGDVAARGLFTRITDGTNQSAVKAASTMPVVADPAVVVSLSPNSKLNLGANAATDIASAAITATTTTAVIVPETFGGSAVFVIPVTVTSGTTPTLDIGVEESDDTGTNWYRIYDFPRITANGIYRSPIIPLNGNRIQYVQTVTGTTPSFTRSILRLPQAFGTSPFRQIIDRSIVLTTSNSVTPSLKTNGAKNIQLTININTATTAPILQLEGSDDNGITWYSIGSTLTAVASSTVQATNVNINAELVRARVSTVGATVVAGYVLLKAFGV